MPEFERSRYPFKTELWLEVLASRYTNLCDVVLAQRRIKQTAIVDHVNQHFEHVLFSSRRVNKTVASGKLARYSVLVGIGNKSGLVGLGKGMHSDKQVALKKQLTRQTSDE